MAAGTTRPHPARKPLAKERQRVQAEVHGLRAQLGAEAEANEERQRPTMRGFKVAQAELRGRLQRAEQRVQALTAKRRHLPKRVPTVGLKTLTKEKKLIVEAIKMIAYPCETVLLDPV